MLSIAAEGERSLGGVLMAALMPWLLVAGLTGGPIVILNFLGLLALLAGLGLPVLRHGLQAERESTLLLSAPVGFILAAALLALAVQRGLPLTPVAACLAGLGLAGLVLQRRLLAAGLRAGVRHGLVYALLSLAVCLLYFLPGALHDGVPTRDGGMQWMYVDTQFHMAVEAAIKSPTGAPRMPGMAAAPISYHFAPFAVASALSAVTGLELPDAHARVLRGVGLLALLAAALALGRVLGRRLGNATGSGLAAVLGLFFYGSLSALFAPELNTSAPGPAPALLFEIPYAYVMHNGGWFSHLILGHSELWGGIGLAAGLALLGERLPPGQPARLRWDGFLLLPALVVALNVMAGIGLVGVVAGILLLAGRGRLRAWTLAAVTVAAAGLIALGMGYVGSPSTSQVTVDHHFAAGAFTLWRWLFVGLGVRIIALLWLRRWREDPMAWALAMFMVGYLAVGFLLKDDFDSHQLYGPKFLQGIFSLFAFAWIGATYPAWRRGAWRITLAPSALRVALVLGLGSLALNLGVLGAGALGLYSLAGAGWSLRLAVAGSIGVAVGAAVLLAVSRRLPRLWRPLSSVMVGVCALGLLAWINPWTNFGLDRLHLEVALPGDEVTALQRLRGLAPPGALVATNHHEQADFLHRKGRSYGYRVVSERPILLEGWEYGEVFDRRFSQVQRDNDLLFTTNDPDTARAIIDRWGIEYLVAEPGTDLPVARRAASWLQPLDVGGSVRIYRVLRSDEGGRRLAVHAGP
jgi:hypothetical protein